MKLVWLVLFNVGYPDFSQKITVSLGVSDWGRFIFVSGAEPILYAAFAFVWAIRFLYDARNVRSSSYSSVYISTFLRWVVRILKFFIMIPLSEWHHTAIVELGFFSWASVVAFSVLCAFSLIDLLNVKMVTCFWGSKLHVIRNSIWGYRSVIYSSAWSVWIIFP